MSPEPVASSIRFGFRQPERQAWVGRRYGGLIVTGLSNDRRDPVVFYKIGRHGEIRHRPAWSFFRLAGTRCDV